MEQTAAQLRSEVQAIAARAARTGRPLRPIPTIEITNRPSSRAFPASSPPRIRLSSRLLRLSPAERAWTIAHELAHVLRYQEGTAWRRTPAWPFVLATGATVAGIAGALLTARTSATLSSLLVLLAILGASGLTWWNLTQLSGSRRNESQTDAVAATIFGEVMSEQWVQRTRNAEGLSRHVPLGLRSHPPPGPRRRAALLAAHEARTRMDESSDQKIE